MQEKLVAFLQVAAALGARKVELLSADTSEKGLAGSAGLTKANVPIRLSASVSAAGSVKRQVFQEFARPKNPPYVLLEQVVWIEHDATLKAMVDNRLRHRSTRLAHTLQVSNMVEQGVSVASKLVGQGFDIGGKVRLVTTSTWQFSVEFWPLPDQTGAVQSLPSVGGLQPPEEGKTSVFMRASSTGTVSGPNAPTRPERVAPARPVSSPGALTRPERVAPPPGAPPPARPRRVAGAVPQLMECHCGVVVLHEPDVTHCPQCGRRFG